MSKSKAKGSHKIVDLTMRFDSGNPNSARFDPTASAPERPITDPLVVADLFRQGNLNYAGFIRDCQSAMKMKVRELPEKMPTGNHFLHLNEFEVARGPEGAGTRNQNPYGAVLSCIDSRVPMELVLGKAADDVFAIRTAGNVLTDLGEANASMHYVLGHYAAGVPGSEGTIPAMLVLGHTRCGAIAETHKAFRPGGSGTAGMPASLAALLYRIKPAVDTVLQCRKAWGLRELEVEDAMSVVNACMSHVRLRRMAAEAGASDDFEVYFAVYDVEDFYFEVTNLPNYPAAIRVGVCETPDKSRPYAWAANAPIFEPDELDEIGTAAANFAKRKR